MMSHYTIDSLHGFVQAAIQTDDEGQRQIAIHHVVQQLPPPHYRTLEGLLRHLSRVAEHSVSTGMNSKNLAIVWAPNLLRPLLALEMGGHALLEVNVQAVIVEYLIKNVNLFFDKDAASIAIVSNPCYSKSVHHSRQPRIRSSAKIGEFTGGIANVLRAEQYNEILNCLCCIFSQPTPMPRDQILRPR